MLPRGSIALGTAVVAVMIAAVMCARTPLLANAGPESGLVLGVVGGVTLALAQARRGAFKDNRGFFNDWLGGVGAAAVFVLIFLTSTAIGGALSPTCSANAGRLPMLVSAVPVLLLQCALGLVIGRTVGRRLAVFACLALELMAAATLVCGITSTNRASGWPRTCFWSSRMTWCEGRPCRCPRRAHRR